MSQIYQVELMEDWNYAASNKKLQKIPLSNKCRVMDFKRAKIVACKPRPNYRVWICFDDGLA